MPVIQISNMKPKTQQAAYELLVALSDLVDDIPREALSKEMSMALALIGGEASNIADAAEEGESYETEESFKKDYQDEFQIASGREKPYIWGEYVTGG